MNLTKILYHPTLDRCFQYGVGWGGDVCLAMCVYEMNVTFGQMTTEPRVTDNFGPIFIMPTKSCHNDLPF